MTKTNRINLRVTDRERRAVVALAKKRKVTVSEVVRHLIKTYLLGGKK